MKYTINYFGGSITVEAQSQEEAIKKAIKGLENDKEESLHGNEPQPRRA